MTNAAHVVSDTYSQQTKIAATSRNSGIDTMRGIAILMVVAIHALQQPLDTPVRLMVDAALRPCVPIFLFASGYLTGLSGRVPLARRLKAALIPYAIAFGAAYLYMSVQNPAMDHRPATTIARFALAYVFVYYYVFVYIGCTLYLWLVLRLARMATPQSRSRLVTLLMISIAVGLIVGSYLDPLGARLGFSDSLLEEIRMRDIPFWFSFVALGVLAAHPAAAQTLRDMRFLLMAVVLTTYLVYGCVRLYGIGDAADYDSTAFFGYAATLCMLMFALDFRAQPLAYLGSGSYFIYLWHVFIIMMLRDNGGLSGLGAVPASMIMFLIAVVVSSLALLAVRRLLPPRIVRWLGA